MSSCEPLILAKVSGNIDMGIHLVSIPACILNSPDLEIKTQVFVDAIDSNNEIIPFDEAEFYSSGATNNPSNIWHMGLVSTPETGFFSITIKSKVVLKGSPCDKPFYPRGVELGIPANQALYSDSGCCFNTSCCGCSDRPDKPPTLHKFKNQVKSFNNSPEDMFSVGQHITNSLVCSCCDY